MKTGTSAFRFDSRGLLRFMVENCKNDLIEIVKEKDNKWIANFLAESIYIGYSSCGQKCDYCYYFDEDLLHILTSNLVLDFASLIENGVDNKTVQRLIAIEMQINKEPFSDKEKSYFCKDIKDYCQKKGINFIPSNDYEK